MRQYLHLQLLLATSPVLGGSVQGAADGVLTTTRITTEFGEYASNRMFRRLYTNVLHVVQIAPCMTPRTRTATMRTRDAATQSEQFEAADKVALGLVVVLGTPLALLTVETPG